MLFAFSSSSSSLFFLSLFSFFIISLSRSNFEPSKPVTSDQSDIFSGFDKLQQQAQASKHSRPSSRTPISPSKTPFSHSSSKTPQKIPPSPPPKIPPSPPPKTPPSSRIPPVDSQQDSTPSKDDPFVAYRDQLNSIYDSILNADPKDPSFDPNLFTTPPPPPPSPFESSSPPLRIPPKFPGDEKVVRLAPSNFSHFISSFPTLVSFVLPGCIHCWRLKGPWGQLADKYNQYDDTDYTSVCDADGKPMSDPALEYPFIVARIDCSVARDFCQKQKVDRFPTIKLYPHLLPGGEQSISFEYQGERSFKGIENWATGGYLRHLLLFLLLISIPLSIVLILLYALFFGAQLPVIFRNDVDGEEEEEETVQEQKVEESKRTKTGAKKETQEKGAGNNNHTGVDRNQRKNANNMGPKNDHDENRHTHHENQIVVEKTEQISKKRKPKKKSD